MVILKNSTRESAKIGQAIDTQFQTGGDPWLAVDIGTTTVVVDLYTSYGELVATLAEDNAQGTYGSDVMMRLMLSKREEATFWYSVYASRSSKWAAN